jgi:serine/threonine-protein kinase RsbW
MKPTCEGSKITIPNDIQYASVAARYVMGVAELHDVSDDIRQDLQSAISHAVTALIEYSFDSHEKATIDISCERIPVGLKITLNDCGVPFEHVSAETSDSSRLSESGSTFNARLLRLKTSVDELHLNNLGREGKEVVLIKMLPGKSVSDYFEACLLEPYREPAFQDAVQTDSTRCSVRPMTPDEAADVSKSVYRTYGYSYVHDYAYYPEQIISLNESGRLYSAVAVSDNGRIAGHCGLQSWDLNPRIAEMVLGVVKPEYRSSGCFAGLTEHLIRHARSHRLNGIFTEAVTAHAYSQKTAQRYGLEGSAILLGMAPSFTSFKRISEKLAQRESMVLQFRYLAEPAPVPNYAPPHHRDVIRRIYRNLGAAEITFASAEKDRAMAGMDLQVNVEVFAGMRYARLIVNGVGPRTVPEIRRRLKQLCLEKIEIIHIFLNLCDPAATALTRCVEELGFFFAGVLPFGLPEGDALVLQFLNNVPIEYARIQLASDHTRQILSYIQQHDPNRL